MSRFLVLPALLTLALPPALLAQQAGISPMRLTDAERQAGWVSLFDGRSTAGWRIFQAHDAPTSWAVVDGNLTSVPPGGDLISDREYGNFELALEWRISSGGNSGILYRVTEAAEATYETGPEMQVLDDARHPDGKNRLTSAGSCFGLYPAPAGIVKPAGEWNAVRILVRGNHVEHWLNGVKVVQYELGSDDWKAKVAASKFKQWPGYGLAQRGHIALQDHGDVVAYRNIRIRELK